MLFESKRSLLKNTIALSAPNWANPFVSLLLVYVLSRRLGVEGMGQYALLSSYLSVFTTIASLGLGGLIVREISRNPEEIHTVTVNSLLFGLLSSLIAIIIMDSITGLLHYDRELLLALIIGSVSLIPASCSRFMESAFLAVERTEFIALGQFFDNLTKVILCTIFVLLGHGIVAISTMTVLARALGLGLLLIFYLNTIGILRVKLDRNVWAMLLKGSPTFLGIAIFSSIYLNIDVILLSKLANVSSVGIYSAASKINQLCVIVPTALSFAVLPTFSRSFVHGLESLRKKTELSIHYILVICLPLTAGIIVLANRLIFFIYGQEFAGSAPILRLIAPSLVFYSLTLILSQALIAANCQRIDLAINIVAAILAVGLNCLLIPRFAEFGAALAGVFTVLIFAILQIIFVIRNMFTVRLVLY
ncbi:MAG: flippase, partial [Deltaproteobacteria bacterium]|nr:flippase [Deltaproteobacteria bacterium]